MGIFDPGPEMLILIVIVIVLLFGAKKIPELARSMGRAKGEFDRGKKEVEREIREEEDKKGSQEKSSKKEDSKVIKAAKELGIDTDGKTDEELKKDIAAKVADSP
jgi:sec-independent protein translocase protein TatA